jgi:hypothetical protein
MQLVILGLSQPAPKRVSMPWWCNAAFMWWVLGCMDEWLSMEQWRNDTEYRVQMKYLEKNQSHRYFVHHLSHMLRAGRSGNPISVGRNFLHLSWPALGPTQPHIQWVPGVKRPGLALTTPPPSSAEIKERVELYLYSPSGPSWPVRGWTVLFTLGDRWWWHSG